MYYKAVAEENLSARDLLRQVHRNTTKLLKTTLYNEGNEKLKGVKMLRPKTSTGQSPITLLFSEVNSPPTHHQKA